MYFLSLEADVHLNVRNCAMDTNPEASSSGHHSGVIFMAPIFVPVVTCYI